MNSLRRKLLLIALICGGVATLATVFGQYVGWIDPLERQFYDWRTRIFQVFTPSPTEALVHLDIDDASLEAIGRWPWSREVLAEVVVELERAGAKLVAFDVMFPEPQTRQYQEDESGRPIEIRPDREFAAALESLPASLLPVSLDINTASRNHPIRREMEQLLRDDPELKDMVVRERLVLLGHDPVAVDDAMHKFVVSARRSAMFDRISHEMGDERLSLRQMQAMQSEIRARVLPETSENTLTPALRLFRQQYHRVLSARLMEAHTRPIPESIGGFAEAQDILVPTWELGVSTTTTGFVDYLPYSDGVVRSVPMWIEFDDRIFPQISLMMACEWLGVDVADVEIQSEALVLPLPDGSQRRIPVRRHTMEEAGVEIATLMDIPWFGPTNDWLTMYDWPEYDRPRQHMSISQVWHLRRYRDRIIANNIQLDQALLFLLANLSEEKFNEYKKRQPPLDMIQKRNELGNFVVQELESTGWIEAIEAVTPDERDESYVKILAAYRAVKQITAANKQLDHQIDDLRAEIRSRVENKVVLIGYTATGLTDMVPTPLHAKCPGVIVHGVIFNGIVTGELWQTASPWLNLLMTLAMGLIATAIVAVLDPVRALIATILLGLAYVGLNAWLVFDYYNIILTMAGPVVVLLTVWSTVTLVRLVVEQREKARINKLFKNYVSRDLVDQLVTDPEQVKKGTHELTCMFTDIAGFTSVTEQLGTEGTVKLLNVYLRSMTERLMGYRAYVNKYMGDAIMAVWSAPIDNPRHALDCCFGVLDCLEHIKQIEKDPQFKNMPRLFMRVGISTGPMMVDDCGAPPLRSDYTVIGDRVNFAARLESANKQFGTQVLISERTFGLIEQDMIVRPIGKFQVVGKQESEMVYELLNTWSAATEEQRRLAELTRRAIDAFGAGRFDTAKAVFDEIESECGPTKLTRLYIAECEAWMGADRDEAEFRGAIALTEK